MLVAIVLVPLKVNSCRSMLLVSLPLTETQMRQKLAMERQSFLHFCKDIGRNPVEFERLLLDIEQRRAREDRGGAFSLTVEQCDRLFSTSDYWEYWEWSGECTRKNRIRFLVESAPRELFCFDFLSDIATTLGLDSSFIRDDDALSLLLDAIPTLTIWGKEFQAFVSGASRFGGIPHVCEYASLDMVLDVFVDVSGGGIFEISNDELTIRDASEIASHYPVDSTPEVLKEVLNFARGAGDAVLWYDPDITFRSRFPSHLTLGQSMTFGAQEFVRSHEWGHFLMGHLLTGPCPKVEFEADLFATRTLSVREGNGLIVGAAFTVFLLAILEGIRRPEANKTHPPATQRLTEFVLSVPKESFWEVEGLMYALATLWNPITRSRHGFEIRLPPRREDS